MKHIEEGTIHAWIDGALSVEGARSVEEHVSECAACAAAVAEARGLVAGASRILGALDDVPANVTPKRAPFPPAPTPARAAPARRQWRAAPWVTGIAAAMMLAVGVSTWTRTEDRGAAPMASDAALSAEPVVTRELRDTTRARSVPAGARVGGVPAEAVAPPAAAPPPSAGTTSPRAPLPQRDVSPGEKAVEAASDFAGRGAAGRAAPSAAPGNVAATEVPRGELRAVAPSSDTASVGRAARGNLALDAVVITPTRGGETRETDASGRAASASGCYPLNAAAESVVTLSEESAKAPTAAAAPSARTTSTARRRSDAPSARATPAEAQPVEQRAAAPERAQAFRFDVGAPIVRLDTTRRGRAYTVRVAAGDSVIGSWSELSTDSVRVTLGGGRVLTLARAARVDCPPR